MKNWQKPEMNQVELKQTETDPKKLGKSELDDKAYVAVTSIIA